MRDSRFFEGVDQVEIYADDPDLGGRLPIFYYDTAMMLALFPARYRAVRDLLPDPRFVPARLAPGLGVVAVACLEHRDTDIGPYGEVGIAIPLDDATSRLNLPGRALWNAERHEQSHAFVVHLPVTTEVALRGGIEFYGFPKFLGEIGFEGTGAEQTCGLGRRGEHILTLTSEKLRTGRGGETQFFFHLWMDRQPQRTEFKVSRLEMGRSLRPGAATLELDERHPIARELGRLLVSRRSLRYDYVPRAEAILYGPDRFTVPLLRRIMATTTDATRSQMAA